MAKFIANNNKSASTKLFLFITTQNLYLYLSFNIIELSNTSTCKQLPKQNALDISGIMQTTYKFAWKAIVIAQKYLLKQANKYLIDISYIIGDKVWLSSKIITTD